jgi:hypothetical protein
MTRRATAKDPVVEGQHPSRPHSTVILVSNDTFGNGSCSAKRAITIVRYVIQTENEKVEDLRSCLKCDVQEGKLEP